MPVTRKMADEETSDEEHGTSSSAGPLVWISQTDGAEYAPESPPTST